jgi:hypothetical protein
MSTPESELVRSFIEMGYEPRVAKLMAINQTDRSDLREVSHLVKGEGDPLTDPAANYDPTADYEKTANSKPNVPGTFDVVSAGIAGKRSFEDTLKILNLKVTDVMNILAALQNHTTRDQAANTFTVWFTSAGFKPADATRAAAALVGPDEFPNAVARAKASGESLDTNHQRPSESLRQSFVNMGYTLTEAERMAKGRE